jgi:hypothetical protein
MWPIEQTIPRVGTALLCAALLWPTQSALAQFAQQAELFGSGALGNAEQGLSVALSGDGNTAIVGGPTDTTNAGAAWVFIRSGGTWSQQAKLFGNGAVGAAQQGTSVALSADGNTAIVGGPNDTSNAGAAWVFTRSGGTWSQQGNKLVGSGAIGSAFQGGSVTLSADGNTAVVGGPQDNSFAGAAWVFTRSGGTWNQEAKLVGTGAIGTPASKAGLSPCPATATPPSWARLKTITIMLPGGVPGRRGCSFAAPASEGGARRPSCSARVRLEKPSKAFPSRCPRTATPRSWAG